MCGSQGQPSDVHTAKFWVLFKMAFFLLILYFAISTVRKHKCGNVYEGNFYP